MFRYGKKIFDKISSMANPEFEDESPIDVFNLWEGANFKLKIRKVDGFSNYDKSEFITAPLSLMMIQSWRMFILKLTLFRSFGPKELQVLR